MSKTGLFAATEQNIYAEAQRLGLWMSRDGLTIWDEATTTAMRAAAAQRLDVLERIASGERPERVAVDLGLPSIRCLRVALGVAAEDGKLACIPWEHAVDAGRTTYAARIEAELDRLAFAPLAPAFAPMTPKQWEAVPADAVSAGDKTRALTTLGKEYGKFSDRGAQALADSLEVLISRARARTVAAVVVPESPRLPERPA